MEFFSIPDSIPRLSQTRHPRLVPETKAFLDILEPWPPLKEGMQLTVILSRLRKRVVQAALAGWRTSSGDGAPRRT